MNVKTGDDFMNKIIVGCIIVLVFCTGYVNTGVAMKPIKFEDRVSKGKMIRIVLEGVQFDFDKSNLRPDAIPILERNVEKLEAMQFSVINVIGYTDSEGTEEYNQVLSENRAQVVKDYLVKRGIASDRIMIAGRGESGAVAPNVMPSGKDYPAGRAKNRRTMEWHIWTR